MPASPYRSPQELNPINQGCLAGPAGEGNGTPLQYSCLTNPMDGGAWKAAVHGVAKSQAQLSLFTFMHGEVNGNPLQCSCLENPRDGGAWWAAVYGVTQSRTRLKRLSSSCRPPSPCTELCCNPDPTCHSVWGLGHAWDPEQGWGSVGGGLRKGLLPRLLPPRSSPSKPARGSLPGYLGPQATVPQAELWGAPLAQKAGGGHDAIGSAGPQVDGVLAQLARLAGA